MELDSKKDIYWAKLQNSNIKNGNISDSLVKQHEKMLMGGIWAIIDVEYDPNIKIGQNIFPFVITEVKPIQLSSFDNSKIINKRKEFTKSEWLDILLRSCGYEPNAEGVSDRIKMLLLSRLLPMVESNFNFIELGPRSTGKSFVFKELTPYAVLISGGQRARSQTICPWLDRESRRGGSMGCNLFDEATDKIFKDRMQSFDEGLHGAGSFPGQVPVAKSLACASIILNGKHQPSQ